jgi:hypothetical protein
MKQIVIETEDGDRALFSLIDESTDLRMLKDQIQNLLNLAEDIVLFQRLASGEI